MLDAETNRIIRENLYSEPGTHVYAVLDGASVEELLPMLAAHEPEHCCLFSGDLAPDYEAAAPHLVRMEPESPFTEWIISQGWGRHWGVFAVSDGDLRSLRKHFRTFLMVRSPKGNPIYFRYYDPRVLRVYLPTLDAQEMEHIYGMTGQIRFFALESQDQDTMLRFWKGKFKPQLETLPLVASPVSRKETTGC